MICYLEEVTELEAEVISKYWELSENFPCESYAMFYYGTQEINSLYKSQKVRSVSTLAKKSIFFVPHPVLICQDCNCEVPAISRKDFLDRIRYNEEIICSDCLELRQQRILDNAHQTLKAFKAEKFMPIAYLKNLSFEEVLALLSLTTEQAENDAFLGTSLDEVTITGVQLLDNKILLSLIDKKALVFIPEIPLDVERASNVIYGDFCRITYENQYKNPVQYRPPESISPGVYINSLALDGGEVVSDISPILYQQLKLLMLSVDDVAKVQQIIKEIQIKTLYELVY